jgi:hypothetical protein
MYQEAQEEPSGNFPSAWQKSTEDLLDLLRMKGDDHVRKRF